ncbi:MAG: S-methyl-5-thioribose-1-phosphate isomerase [Gemmatimonadetes bacterium]|nr:MAG: S-methyl-5-thioribose-1-phosphate isomerase [Gemmatimonadota bacterium]
MFLKSIEWKTDHIEIIDQTQLPEQEKRIQLRTLSQITEAIQKLRIRGAPAIGIAGAMGLALIMDQTEIDLPDAFFDYLYRTADQLNATRPTAVNLGWALRRMIRVAEDARQHPLAKIREALIHEAQQIAEEEAERSIQMGKFGAELIQEGDTLLTHCNTGALATYGYGTALSVFYQAHQMGKRIHVFADETRPLLQGSRLTVWELQRAGIPVTLITDNMAGWAMAQGKIQRIFTGADRIAANGDSANKIGTYSVATLAKAHNIPFYIVAPSSTIDASLKSGAEIPIEERGAAEIIRGFGKLTAPEGTSVWSPAFDVTPAELISGIITEAGVFEYPYAF